MDDSSLRPVKLYRGQYVICLYDNNEQLVFIAETINQFVSFEGKEVNDKTLHCARNKIRQANRKRGTVKIGEMKLKIRLVKS